MQILEFRLKRGDAIKSIPATLTSLCRNDNLIGQLNVFLNKEILSEIMDKTWIPDLELHKNFLKIGKSEIDFCIDCDHFKVRLREMFQRSSIDIKV